LCKPTFYFSNNSEQKTKQVIKTVANGKISEQFALAKLKIIDLADEGDKDPVNSFLKKNIKINTLKMSLKISKKLRR
jgi:hypothetical protein